MGKIEAERKKMIVDGSGSIGLPKAVVAPEFVEEIPLRDAWLGTLIDKRRISEAIKYTTKLFPGMSHLKRCSDKRLILAFAAPIDGEGKIPGEETDKCLSRRELDDLLSSNDTFDISQFESDFEIIGVPAGPPKTKAQARSASKIWPINFHPDPWIESTLDGSCFDIKNLETIDRCMKLCIAAAREARGNDDCNGTAIIFDPVEEEIVAFAASSIDLHPMWHAAMLAVDLVASLERGGGVYELTSETVSRKRKYSRTSDGEEPPLAYPTGLVDILHRGIISRDASAETSSFSRSAGDFERRRKQRDVGRSAYLCTNYWVFLLREPCAMCAMALVHSRVSNIFYGSANERRGVLGSRALLHATPGLNHRYRVWRGIREEECDQTCIEISRR